MKRLLATFGFLMFVAACGTSISVPPTSTPSSDDSAVVQSSEAEKYVGKSATVEVKRAYCSYQTRTRGSPTFCNDAPYPKHHCTMLVWGSNRKAWSTPPESWDGKCLRVTGMVTTYQGKPQIEAKEPSQISSCPGQ